MAGTPPRLIIPAFGPLYERLGAMSYPFMRVVCGLMLLLFGWKKLTSAEMFANEVALFHKLGFEPAVPLSWFIVLLEVFGGILLALGLLTRPVAVAIFIEMMVITFMGPRPAPEYFTLLWGLMVFAMIWRGGGRCSLDRKIGREF